MNAVFLATIEENPARDEPIGPTQMFSRGYLLVRKGNATSIS
jgi:hypothetical protein